MYDKIKKRSILNRKAEPPTARLGRRRVWSLLCVMVFTLLFSKDYSVAYSQYKTQHYKQYAFIELNDVNKYSSALHEVITTTKKKVNAYVITTSPSEQLEEIAEKFAIDKGFISNDFKDFSLKFGVNIDDTMIANSIFVIVKSRN